MRTFVRRIDAGKCQNFRPRSTAKLGGEWRHRDARENIFRDRVHLRDPGRAGSERRVLVFDPVDGKQSSSLAYDDRDCSVQILLGWKKYVKWQLSERI